MTLPHGHIPGNKHFSFNNFLYACPLLLSTLEHALIPFPLSLLQAMASTIFFPRRKLRAFAFLVFLVSTITLFVTPLCVLVFEHYHANQLSQHNRRLLRASQHQDPLPRLPIDLLHGVQYTRRQRLANIQCFPVCNFLYFFFLVLKKS